MVLGMEDRASLLKLDSIKITSDITVCIPTVGDVLENERHYYELVSALTSNSYSYMVQLDDMGLDFDKTSDFDLFCILFLLRAGADWSLIFGDLDTDAFCLEASDDIDGRFVLKNKNTGVIIDEFTHSLIADAVRDINGLKKEKKKAGNEGAKKYLIEKQRRYNKRHRNDKYKPYLENIVIALVNRRDFKYNYEDVMDLNLFKLNKSYEQITHSSEFDNTMLGIYTGNIDASKLKNKDCLSLIMQSN